MCGSVIVTDVIQLISALKMRLEEASLHNGSIVESQAPIDDVDRTRTPVDEKLALLWPPPQRLSIHPGNSRER